MKLGKARRQRPGALGGASHEVRRLAAIACACAKENLMPAPASASIVGVRAGPPSQPSASPRSVSITTVTVESGAYGFRASRSAHTLLMRPCLRPSSILRTDQRKDGLRQGLVRKITDVSQCLRAVAADRREVRVLPEDAARGAGALDLAAFTGDEGVQLTTVARVRGRRLFPVQCAPRKELPHDRRCQSGGTHSRSRVRLEGPLLLRNS
jgi:hypothetical protein